MIISHNAKSVSKLNPIPVTTKGDTLQEQLTESDAETGVLTFSDDIDTILIYNTDGTNAGTFEVNGITINVPKGESFKTTVGGTPGKTVTITGATTYIVSRYT